MRPDDDEPRYVISVAAKMLGLHAQTLRYYERAGLIEPSRSGGKRRIYSARDIRKLLQIKRLLNDLGVNLAGVEIILRMADRMLEIERQLRLLEGRIKEQQGSETVEGEGSPGPQA